MFVESSYFSATLPDPEPIPRRDNPRHVLSNSSYAMPYKQCQASSNQSLLSLHDQTQNDTREKRQKMSFCHFPHVKYIQNSDGVESQKQECVQNKAKENLEIAAEANVEKEESREVSNEVEKQAMTSKRKSSKKSSFIVFKSRFDKLQKQIEKKGSKHFERKSENIFWEQ